MTTHPQKRKLVIGFGDSNRLIGENHQHSKLSNVDVERIREIHDSGLLGYRELARAFNSTRDTIRGICTYRRRAVTIEKYITLTVEGDKELTPIEVRAALKQYMKNKKGYR